MLGYRRMTRSERLALALGMSEDMRALAAAGATWRMGAGRRDALES